MVPMIFPQWLANPIYFLALIALLVRGAAGAMALGFVALLIALSFWSAETSPGNKPAETGYWLWLAAMGLIVIGGCLLSLTHPPGHQGKVRSFRIAG